MGLISRGLFVVAVAAMAFASFLIVSGGANHRAEAQTPADGAFTIAKVCVPNVSATFDFEVTVEIDGVEADELSGSIDIACGEAATFPTDGLVSELDGVEADTPVSITVGEGTTDVPVETIEFQGDCTINTTAEAFLDDLETDGFLCTITNTIDLATLRVVKECPAGFGGTPSFLIVVEGLTVDFSDVDDIVCTGTLTFPGLLPGIYSVQEIIGGSDDFTTVMTCNDATNAQGTDLDLNVTIGFEDVTCTITNVLVEEDDGAPINNTNNNIINVNSTNTNDNANNNNNANENANNNANENNNANTNTQNQTNDQDQTNNNTQTTDVNASPVVNISGAGALSGGGGGGTTVRAPSTGDGGLLGLQRQEAGYVTWVAAAGVLLLLAAARARDLWSEK